MAVYQNLLRGLQLLILGVLNFDAVANPSFVMEPTDDTQIIAYGSTYSLTVTLNCAVRNLQTGQSVAWYKNGVRISNNGTVYSNYVDGSRYTVDIQGLYATFNLKIMTSAVTAFFDSDIYQCVVMTTPPLESRTARLDIFVTPMSGYVRCSIGDNSLDDVYDVVSGIPIRLACRSDPTGVPEITTQWRREGHSGETFNTVTSTDGRDDSRVLSFSWTPTNQQNNATFICTGFHPVYTTNRRCQLGPFNVQYKPIVQISPSSYTVTMVSQVVTFTCIADANPPVASYVWSNTAGENFRPLGANVIVGSNGTWMQMRNFESHDNGMYDVTCYAENDIGTSVHDVATLNINIQFTTVTEHSNIASSTTTVNKQYGNVSSDGRHDMTSITVVSTGTATVYDIGKTAKTSQMNTVFIIGGTAGGCGFILIVFGVILTTFCVYKSRKKSHRKESPDTHTVLNPYDEVANVNSVDLSQSSYSTVNVVYDTENDIDGGDTTNTDSASVEITLQAKVFFKNTDRNKEDTGQSMIESDLLRVEKQRTSLSTTNKMNCDKTEIGNDFSTKNEERKDKSQKSQTARHRPMILPKPSVG